jgi:hypothetical protein
MVENKVSSIMGGFPGVFYDKDGWGAADDFLAGFDDAEATRERNRARARVVVDMQHIMNGNWHLVGGCEGGNQNQQEFFAQVEKMASALSDRQKQVSKEMDQAEENTRAATERLICLVKKWKEENKPVSEMSFDELYMHLLQR